MGAINVKKTKNYPLIKTQRFFLCLYFFSIHFESWDPFFTGIDYLITKVTIMSYIIVSVFGFTSLKILKKHKKYIFPICIIFLIETSSGFFYKRNGFVEYFSLVSFLNIIIFVLSILQLTKDFLAIEKALKAFAFGGIVLTGFFLLGIQTSYSHGGRVSVFGVNQNLLAVNLSIVLLIIINSILNERSINKFIKILYLISVPLLFVFLASTGSRSGFVSLIGGLVILVYSKKYKNPFAKLMSLIVGFISLLSILYYFSSNKIIGDRISNSIRTGDLSNRDKYWENIFTLADINPYFGIGKTGYAYETEQMFGYYTSSHNVFLEVLITGGIISLMFLLIFLFRVIKKAISSGNLITIVFLAPIFVTFLVGHPFGTKIIWGLFAFIIILKKKSTYIKL